MARWRLWCGRNIYHLAFTLTAWVLASACGGPFQVEAERPLAEEISLPPGIVVMPVAAMSHKAGAIEVAVRSSETAAWLLDNTELTVLGPLDFKTLKEVDDANLVSTDTDLSTRSDTERIDLAGWWSIHILVTESRANSSRRIVDTNASAEGKTVSNVAGIESQLRMELTVREAMRGRVLAQVVLIGNDELLHGGTPGDPRPIIRQLIERGLAMVFEPVLERLQPSPQRRIRSAQALPSAPALMALGFLNLPSLAESMAARKEFERETAMIGVWERLFPDLPPQVTIPATRNPGVLMLQSTLPLERFDIVMAIDGHQVRDRYQLDRRLRVCGPTCRATLWRSGAQVELPLNLPPVPRPVAN